MSEVTIKVSTDELRKCAQKASTLSNQIWQDLDQLYECGTKTIYSNWEGAAADQFRAVFQSSKDDLDEMMRRVNKYPEDLLQMAGLYDEAESTNVDSTGQLQTDFIEG